MEALHELVLRTDAMTATQRNKHYLQWLQKQRHEHEAVQARAAGVGAGTALIAGAAAVGYNMLVSKMMQAAATRNARARKEYADKLREHEQAVEQVRAHEAAVEKEALARVRREGRECRMRALGARTLPPVTEVVVDMEAERPDDSVFETLDLRRAERHAVREIGPTLETEFRGVEETKTERVEVEVEVKVKESELDLEREREVELLQKTTVLNEETHEADDKDDFKRKHPKDEDAFFIRRDLVSGFCLGPNIVNGNNGGFRCSLDAAKHVAGSTKHATPNVTMLMPDVLRDELPADLLKKRARGESNDILLYIHGWHELKYEAMATVSCLCIDSNQGDAGVAAPVQVPGVFLWDTTKGYGTATNFMRIAYTAQYGGSLR